MWEMLSLSHIVPLWIFPSPEAVVSALRHQLTGGFLFPAIVSSFRRLIIGFSISLLLGTGIGIALSRSQVLRQTLGVVLLGFQTLPSICWLPMAILWFGLSDTAIIFVIVVGTVVSVALATASSIRMIPVSFLRAGVMLDARGIKLYQHIIFPAMFPSYFIGIKQAWSFAWRALISGEMLFVTTGLGQLLMFGRDLNDVAQVAAIMVVILLLGILVDYGIFHPVENEIGKRWGFEILK
jgi:NitT/TauT family transport system permease protein